MDWFTFDLEQLELVKTKRFDEAEHRLLELHEQAKDSEDPDFLDEVLGRLADHYSCPVSENVPKAAHFVSQREELRPTPYNRLRTALFLMMTIGDIVRALEKLDEIALLCSEKQLDDPRSCFWATALRGICLLRVGRIDECEAIVQRLLHLAKSFGPHIFPGDAIGFLKELVRTGRVPMETGTLLTTLERQSTSPETRKRFSLLQSELAGSSPFRIE
jgi:hypothetical protein